MRYQLSSFHTIHGNIFVSLTEANKSLLLFQESEKKKERKRLRRQRDLEAEALQEKANSKLPSLREAQAEDEDLDVDDSAGDKFVSWFENAFAPFVNIFKDIAVNLLV